MLSEIKKLRKELHQYPELSGYEMNTAKRIKSFINTHNKTHIIDTIGGHGLVAIYGFSKEGPTIMIRCELDALPIQEKNTFGHKSKIENVSHKCGHDGHMAMVVGLIFWLKKSHLKRGTVILLFQPAEETGKGAYKMIQDEKFKALTPDYVFALHNLPGEPLHTIITKPESFSASVQSMTVFFKGKEAHASEPENGINPTLAISEVISAFSELNNSDPKNEDFAVLTPIHINMGQKSYGVSPANGELHYTLRTWNEKVMKTLENNINRIIETICKTHLLKYKTEWFEYFPTTMNNETCNTIINQAAKKNNFKQINKSYPLKFGEDFGWFSQKYKVAMFGLGAGINVPALHHADYDFPDELLETGITMYKTIIENIITANQ